MLGLGWAVIHGQHGRGAQGLRSPGPCHRLLEEKMLQCLESLCLGCRAFPGVVGPSTCCKNCSQRLILEQRAQQQPKEDGFCLKQDLDTRGSSLHLLSAQRRHLSVTCPPLLPTAETGHPEACPVTHCALWGVRLSHQLP